ncbi:MAG: META domain-containing protein [Acidimicrobiia bacterium]
MRSITPMFLALFLVAAACGDDTGTSSSPLGPDPASLFDTSWVGRQIFSSGVPVGVIGDAEPRIGFLADGSVSGTTGCNSFFGGITIDAGTLSFGGLGVTEMGCEPPLSDQEGRVLQILGAADRWSLADGVLTIGAADGTGAIEWVAPAPVANLPLEDTQWRLDTLVDGDVATTPHRDAEATLQIRGGSISGSTGCNEYGGEGTVRPPVFDVGPLSVTERACGQDVMSQEAFLLEALAEADRIEVDGASVTISGPGGKALVFRSP